MRGPKWGCPGVGTRHLAFVFVSPASVIRDGGDSSPGHQSPWAARPPGESCHFFLFALVTVAAFASL
jgi:hypothetical protein